MSSRTLRLGTRGSKLARWQADWVANRLRELGAAVEVIEIRTSGDAQQTGPIEAIGAQGVFTKEIQQALLADRVDLAVHSLKDLPTTPVDGLTLAAVPEREGARDAFVSNSAASIADLPHGARVGTGSTRRKAQLLNLRPDLEVLDLRGNVDTRLRKLDEGQYDAILLAEAGLKRLGLAERVTQAIPTEVVLPAPGQGALGIECRAGDSGSIAALKQLDDARARAEVTAERDALAKLEAGCLAALGAHATQAGDELTLSVVVLSEDGQERLFSSLSAEAEDAEGLGQRVANDLRARGAAALLRPRG